MILKILGPCQIERAHLPKVRLAESTAKLPGQIASELADQGLSILRAFLSLLLELDNPPSDLPIARRHQRIDAAGRCGSCRMKKRDNLCSYIAVVLFDHVRSRVTMLHVVEMEIGLIPHGPARCSAWQKFVASLSQIPSIGPALPTLPVDKPFAVYNLAGDSLHAGEAIIEFASLDLVYFLKLTYFPELCEGPKRSNNRYE